MLLIIIAIGILATIGMTIFSYIISFFTSNKVEEPQLLNEMVFRLRLGHHDLKKEHVVGWAIHLIIGIFFSLLYFGLLNYNLIDRNYLHGIIFGLIAGFIGVLGWKLLEVLHPNPPSSLKMIFYAQLIPAHIIFGLCLSWLATMSF